MSDAETRPVITLGRREFPIAELSFKRLRKVLPTMGLVLPSLSKGPDGLTEEVLDAMLLAIYHGCAEADPALKLSELEDLPITIPQLAAGAAAVARLLGAQTGAEGPNAEAVANGTGMQSMPTSSPQPDGPGSTSTTE